MRTAPTRPVTSPRAYCSNGCCILRANGRNPSLHRAKSHDSLRFRPDAEQAVPQTWEGYRLFEDAAGRTIAVYTSAYARFADREIPAGECSLTGVLEYGTAGSYGKQFILQMRDENDCTH